MSLNKKNKNKNLAFILLSLFLISSLFQSTQNVFAEPNHQDDNDLGVTLHSRLVSSSGEFASDLMPIGTYSFFETPQLDIGSFSHDLTYIDVDDIQYPISTNTSTKNYNFTNLGGNQTIESPELPEYDLSAPEDTIIEAIIDYDTNVSEFDLKDSYSIDLDDPDLESIYYDGSSWWFLGTNTKRVYEYDNSFTYTGYHCYLGAEDSAPKGIHKEGSYWYVLGTTNDKIFKYDLDWVYTDTSYDISSQDTDAVDIYFNDSYWYLVGDGNNRIYKYTSAWSYSTSYDISSEDTSPRDIVVDGEYWILIGDQNDKIYRYDSSWSYQSTFYDMSSQDNQLQSMFINDDYIWVSGGQNDKIYKYRYPSDFYSHEATYNFGALSPDPLVDNYNVKGITWDGTYFYMTDSDPRVFKCLSDFSSVEAIYDIGTLSGDNYDPEGITWDGTYFYVTDSGYHESEVFKYTSNFSSLEATYNLLALGGNDDPKGIAWDGTYFYVTDDDGRCVYKYNSDFSSLEASYDLLAFGTGSPRGIEFVDGYFYVVDSYDDYVYKYPSDFSSLITYYDVGALTGSITHWGVNFNGTYFYTTDYHNEYVHRYSGFFSYTGVSYNDDFILNFKSTYWDGTYWYVVDSTYATVLKYDSTWTYTESFYDISSQDSNPKGIYFYNNYWYVVGDTNNRIYKYTSSWTYTYSSYDISSEDTSPRDICYYNSYWYLIGDGNNRVYKYTSGWSYTDTSYDISSQDTSPSGIFYYNSYWYLVGDQNDKVYKYDSSFSYTEYSYNISSEDTSPTGLFYTDDYWYLIGDSNDKIFEYFAIEFFSSVWVINFTYQISGMDYYEDYELSYDASNSIKDGINKNGTLVYYFDSSFFSQYDYITNVKVLEQNLTLVFNNIYNVDQVNFSLVINWSSNTWRVPTEVALTINGNSVIDETYNSGYVYLDTFPNTLTITANLDVYFKLNITSYFTFTFDLEIISKTYLRNDFKLLSDHSIYIETVALDSDLNIKKIYLNNIDLGFSNPNHLSPAMQMDQNNIFNLEIILSEELYRNLPYDNNRELYSEDWSDWNLGYDSDDTISSFNDGNLSSQLQAGHYPATYSFTGEVGKTGTDIGFVDVDSNTITEVINNFNNHKSVLKFNDIGGTNFVYHYFSNSMFGIMEYWICPNDATERFNMYLGGSGGAFLSFRIQNDQYIFYNKTNSQKILNTIPLDNVWQHIKMVWRSDDTLDIYINGVKDIDNDGIEVGTGFSQVSIASYDSLVYFDAFGSDKDPNYKIGDNLYYENYMGTHDFENYDIAYNLTTLDGFILTTATNCSININGSYDAYKKQIEMFDNSTVHNLITQTTFDSAREYGTIEFWIRTTDATLRNGIGVTSAFYLKIEADKFQYYDGAYHDVGLGASDDTWYHIRIDFECQDNSHEGLSADTWKVWVDGVEYGTYAFGTVKDNVDNINFFTSTGNSDYIFYIDSVSYSWEDPIGINLLKEMSEIDNPYTTINKTISSTDLELYSYTVAISFTYKFTQYGAYLNTTKMNDIELIDDNTYHIYSTTITTSQHSFFYTFNISNGIFLLSDFNFVIENQHSIQKTINPITTIDSVEFKEYLQADRTFEYWYYRNIYTINNLEIEHDPSSTITSSFGYENHKYYFSQYANTDDEFTGTIDYNPNWQISFTFIVNNATYSKVKVDYGADFVIYNTTLVLDLRNSGIFDDIENPNRDNYVLNIDSLSFSSTTQSLYIIGNRTQQTPNPQTDVDLVQLNEEFTYNSQVLSSSYVSVNPNWQISTSVIDKNGTYGKLEIDYKADLPLINVDLKTSVKRNNMFSDVVETKDYQNDTSIYFQLDGLSFTTDYQSTYVEGFRTLLESDITTDDIYLDYNEEYKWSSTSLSNYTVGLCPCWLVSTSVLENNGTYGKVQVDFKADLSLINVDLKFSILRNVIFGDSIEIKGYQNTTEINFILENVNFTTSLQSEVVEGFRTLLGSDITTDDIYLDYNEEYIWNIISLSNYSIEVKPNWDVSFSYVYNNASYSYIQSDYSSDLDFYNVTMNLDLRNTAIFDDMDNQGKDDYLLTIEYLNFTTSTKTLYITGTRTQYTSNPQTDLNIIQLNETITYNSEVLTTSLVDNDPNWQISISVIQKNATYGKLEVEYKSDATYTNVDLKTSITRNNMFDDSVEVKGYQDEITLSFELSAITFTSSFQTTYIEGFRYLDEIDIHTNMSYVDYEERYYWSSVSLSNYSIEINPNWVILSSIVEYNGTYSKIKIQCKSDIAINNVALQFSRSRNSIFGDIYELAGYQNITKIEFNLQNVNFTSLYQTTYIECFRSLTQINPNTNMTYLDFEEQYYWNSTSLSNHSIRINPNWNVGYSIISNNGTFAQLNISYYSDLFISDILLKLSLRYDDLYAENWSNNAQQSIYTYILEIPDINFTTSEQILNLTGVSSVPYCNFSSFINEDGFKLSDEEWRIKITDEEWRTITKSNWEDIEVYMYGYVQFTKYSRVFIISDMEDDWELDGVHYQGIPYDISATGYFTCEGWGSGITSAYLRFKTNPIEDLRREQTREQVIYKIKSKYDLEDVDFIFYIEEDERYNINDMIKQLKKEIDCTDIIKYYSVEDRDYYMIMDMDLDEGTNKITIYYKIENAAKYSWAFLIVGIAMIGFSIIYISYRYYDNKILDFIGLDKLVKYFFWIKKSERIKMTKKYRLNKKKKKRGKK